jgi:hypothetical protein
MKRSTEFIGLFLAIIGSIIALAALIVAMLNWLSPFDPVGPSPIIINNQQNPSSPSNIEPSAQPIVIVVTATSPVIVNPPSSDGIISCDENPINGTDDVAKTLDSTAWYMIEDFDNAAAPPVHKFLARRGPGSVNVTSCGQDIVCGQRAWKCENQESAKSIGLQSAIGYKAENPGHVVYGPDEQEIR